MKDLIIPFSLSISIFLFTITSCKKSTPETVTCTGDTPTYTVDIKPIIDANCATSGCHDATNAGGFKLTTYTACNNAKDDIAGTVQHASGFKAMPEGKSKLDDATVQKISCWAQNGAPE